MKRNCIYYCYLTVVLLCWALASCVSDLEFISATEEWVEGATVSVNVSVSDMPVRTRGENLEAPEWNTIKDVYVAIYNVNTGKRIAHKFVSQSSSDLHTDPNGLHKVELGDVDFFTTEKYYIVGVANSQRAYGIYVKDGDDTPELNENEFEYNKEYRLSRLLECADTWEKYRRISSSVDPFYVDAAQFKENVVMAGSYSTGGGHAPAGLPQKVSIMKSTDGSGKATIEGNGFIHLERLVSHFDVNLIAGEGVTLNPMSWQVFNVPAAAFLQEREGISVIGDVAGAAEQYYTQTPNAADIIEYTHQGDDGEIYAKSLEGRFGNANTDGSYSFDFFQYENKHTGLTTTCTEYAHREKEFKSNEQNTGIYQSLCPSIDAAYNNKAGYFVIKTGIDCTDENNKHYFGTAEYTIHLGYIGNKAVDFNCERNTKYIYNITVNGVNDIIVEAKKDGELHPGAEGDILTTDETTPVVNLDAHYGVFNVTFKAEDMTPTATLHWRMTCPYGNDVVTLEGKVTNEGGQKTYDNSQFYNWVQFVPTTKGVVQTYPEGGKEGKATNEMLYINDLTWNGEEEDKTYTVFVDEYVYEYAYNPNAASTGYTGDKFDSSSHKEYHKTWANYVNKGNRRLTIWFTDENKEDSKSNVYVSSDDESIYTELPALVISQKSIQTYYDILAPTPTALGIEHYDEYSRDGTLDANRYNRSSDIFSTGNMNGDQNYTFNGDARTWMYDVYNRNNKGWNDFLQAKLVNSGNLYGENGDYLYDDKGTHYYLNSCLARNRDLNGNGKIDADEVRWYMPQRSTFVRMFTGNIMLESPLYDYTKKWELGDVSENIPHGQAGSRYAMACGHQFYAYQAFSIGPIQNPRPDAAPWQVRCIRDLGVSMANTTNDNARPYDYKINNSGVYEANSVEKAYTIDTNKQIIDLSNYDRQALRATLDELKVNRVSERNSQPALKFQYSSSYCDDSNLSPEYKADPHRLELTNGYSGSFAQNDPKAAKFQESVNYNSVCKYYREPNQEIDLQSDKEWRVPNISEAAILYDAGIISATDFDNTTDGVFSSTVWAVGYDWVSRVMPKSPNGNFVTVSPGSSSRTRVRCVRDIE